MGCAARPLRRAADEPTTEDIRIDMGVRRAQDLGSGTSGRRTRVEPSKRLIGEHIERRHPAEVERIEPAKRRVVPSKRRHAAICKVREPTNGFVHGGLGSGSNKVLCASGCAWAGGSRGGQLVERERGKATDRSVYTWLLLLLLLLLLLRPITEREVEMLIGEASFGGGRESGYEACRPIGGWESSEGGEGRAKLDEGGLLLGGSSRILGVGAG